MAIAAAPSPQYARSRVEGVSDPDIMQARRMLQCETQHQARNADTPELPVPIDAVPLGPVLKGGSPLDGPVPIGAVLTGAVPEGGRLPDRVPKEFVNGTPELPVPRGAVPLGPVLRGGNPLDGPVPTGGKPLEGPVPTGAVLTGAVPDGGRLPDLVPSELVNGTPELPVGRLPLGAVPDGGRVPDRVPKELVKGTPELEGNALDAGPLLAGAVPGGT